MPLPGIRVRRVCRGGAWGGADAGVAGFHMLFAVNTHNQGRPIGYPELLENMIQMGPDGPIADPEIMGDGAVRRAAGDKRDDLVFPARQCGKPWRAALLVRLYSSLVSHSRTGCSNVSSATSRDPTERRPERARSESRRHLFRVIEV